VGDEVETHNGDEKNTNNQVSQPSFREEEQLTCCAQGESETILLYSNRKGQLYTSSQIQDYLLRGVEMEACTFFSFIVDTWEEAFTPMKEKPNESRANPLGRPRHERAHYLPEHPKTDSHRRVFRINGHNTLPHIQGPWFPRHDDIASHEYYCACMLALLKPWRRRADLIGESGDWTTAFQMFISTAKAKEKRVLGGINYYYESKTACESNDGGDDHEDFSRNEEKSGGSASFHDMFDETADEDGDTFIPLTEADLKTFKAEQISPRERAHAHAAIAIGTSCGIFSVISNNDQLYTETIRTATALDFNQLASWQTAMQKMMSQLTPNRNAQLQHSTEDDNGEVTQHQSADLGDAFLLANITTESSSLSPSKPEELLEDQRRTYDIVDWHLQKFLSGFNPPQLRMVIPGEGGVGKSKTIQTITDNFVSRGVAGMLVKSAYTGIAASVIDGKTLHVIAMIPINGGKQSAVTMKALEDYWNDKHYLIIDEISMVSREFFAKLSNIIAQAKAGRGIVTNEPFGGLNVILVGDFHQFPPVACKASAPLYWPCNHDKDNEMEILGCKLYEQFDTVVRLKTQVRVTDPEWVELLQHARNGSCKEHHLATLRSLILTHDRCPATDFSTSPWKTAVLVTPRHAVRMQWNYATARCRAGRNRISLLTCPAFDSIQGRPLTLQEKFSVAAKSNGTRSRNQQQRGGLPNEIELAIGMEVMVTFNVSTDLDMANGARGHILDIVLDPREDGSITASECTELQYPPLYVLVQMKRTKASPLNGLQPGVLPITPLSRTFTISASNGSKSTVTRQQLPITPAYAFTDYRSQGQTIEYCIVDIGTPPTGRLTPFNVYVALSRSRGKSTIRLLRDFDDKLFTQHPSEYLRKEDLRLEKMDQKTTLLWQTSSGDNQT